jgi:tRNA pseudouridine38-40 synthase
LPQYAALVAYDGTAYYGFQRQQASQPTIQSQLEQAILQVTQQEVGVTGAGRTDSGVHALGQVAGFSVEWQHEAAALHRAINANLPDDIAILQLKEVPTPHSFHPRFDARRRTYRYQIYNAAVRSPVTRLYSWQVQRPLDLERMNTAAQSLIGVQDFATFGQPPQGENSVREVFTARWERQGDFLLFWIEANAFLQRMVRSLVGSLKLVGDGSWQVADFVAALQSRSRDTAGITAPPQGLFLIAVTYEHLTFESKD